LAPRKVGQLIRGLPLILFGNAFSFPHFLVTRQVFRPIGRMAKGRSLSHFESARPCTYPPPNVLGISFFPFFGSVDSFSPPLFGSPSPPHLPNPHPPSPAASSLGLVSLVVLFQENSVLDHESLKRILPSMLEDELK